MDGRVIGHYKILEKIGAGAMGEVFRARDERLGREVALKQIKTAYADLSESRARFVREAEITGGPEHPGVVPVYGLATTGQNDDDKAEFCRRRPNR